MKYLLGMNILLNEFITEIPEAYKLVRPWIIVDVLFHRHLMEHESALSLLVRTVGEMILERRTSLELQE